MLFGLLGLVFAAWAARIPAVRDGLHLTAGQLGLALLCAGVGGLASFPLAATMVARCGQAKAALTAGLALLVALACIGCSASLPALMVALALLGGSASCFDVAINAIGADAEKKAGRSIMSMLHAWFCVGTVSGALSGSVIAGAGVTPQVHFLVLASVMAVPLWLACRVLAGVELQETSSVDPISGASSDARPDFHSAANPNVTSPPENRFHLLPRPLLILGLIGFFGAIAENGIADWSGLYMHDHMGASVGTAPLGYAAFTGAMLLTRLVADRLKDRFGARRVVAGGALLAVMGIGIAVGAQALLAIVFGAEQAAGAGAGNASVQGVHAFVMPLAIAGFAIAGAGLAGVFPFVFSAAGSAGPNA